MFNTHFDINLLLNWGRCIMNILPSVQRNMFSNRVAKTKAEQHNLFCVYRRIRNKKTNTRNRKANLDRRKLRFTHHDELKNKHRFVVNSATRDDKLNVHKPYIFGTIHFC